MSENHYLSYQVEGGVARGSHTCKKILWLGCGQEEPGSIMRAKLAAMNKSPVITHIIIVGCHTLCFVYIQVPLETIKEWYLSQNHQSKLAKLPLIFFFFAWKVTALLFELFLININLNLSILLHLHCIIYDIVLWRWQGSAAVNHRLHQKANIILLLSQR